MAYNVLKGIVEGSVDQHADQEIKGIKVFKNAISASVFYDTDADSPCATLKQVPIQSLIGGSPTAVLTYQGDLTAKSEYNLTFDGTELKTKKVKADAFYGSAEGLVNLPGTRFSEPVPAHHIKFGQSLRNIRAVLEVKADDGLCVRDTGLAVDLHPKGGLNIRDAKLIVDPKSCLDVTARGQNLSDDDCLLIHDVSRGETRRTTLSNLYSSYINSKSLQPEGALHSLQLKGQNRLNGSAALTFDPTKKLLNIDGMTRTDSLRVDEMALFGATVEHQGAVTYSVSTVTGERYEVKEDDYTILGDTSAHIVTVVLPPPSEMRGRVLVIKKINSKKYKLNSNVLYVEAEDSLIDIHEKLTIKYNYSTIQVQSSGDTWCLIGRTGS